MVKIKKVTIYEYRPLSKYEMKPKGEVYINPYLVTIGSVKKYFTTEEVKKEFALLYQKDNAYYILLDDLKDIIEIC